MQRNIVLTGDGSSTIQIPDMDVTYHSKHGAIQESRHIFISAGLEYYQSTSPHQTTLSILEMGFGTGLNALLTCQYAQQHDFNIYYETIEAYPLSNGEVSTLNYGSLLGDTALFSLIHEAAWNEKIPINDRFVINKRHTDLATYTSNEKFHIVYFDAFAPGPQPELWTEEIFRKLYDLLLPSGVLVTYCSKVIVQKALKAAGFTVAKLPGPPGKREILRALK